MLAAAAHHRRRRSLYAQQGCTPARGVGANKTAERYNLLKYNNSLQITVEDGFGSLTATSRLEKQFWAFTWRVRLWHYLHQDRPRRKHRYAKAIDVTRPSIMPLAFGYSGYGLTVLERPRDFPVAGYSAAPEDKDQQHHHCKPDLLGTSGQ